MSHPTPSAGLLPYCGLSRFILGCNLHCQRITSRSNYLLLQVPTGRSRPSPEHHQAALLSPLLSVFSFRRTCPRPFCEPEAERAWGLSCPSQKTLWTVCTCCLGGSRLLLSHIKTIFFFHICKMKRNGANNCTCNQTLLPVTSLVSGVEGAHTAFTLPSCEAVRRPAWRCLCVSRDEMAWLAQKAGLRAWRTASSSLSSPPCEGRSTTARLLLRGNRRKVA